MTSSPPSQDWNDDRRAVAALLADADRARRRRRVQLGSVRSAAVLGSLAAALGLAALLGLLSMKAALGILVAAALAAASLVTVVGVRRDSPATAARWLDRAHHELDLYTTAAEILSPRPDRLPSRDPAWQELVLRRAAQRGRGIDPAALVEPLPVSERRLAAAGLTLAAISWLAIGLLGLPTREVPVEVVELPASESLDGAVPVGEAATLGEDAEPLDPEELAALTERELESPTETPERGLAEGEPGEESGEGDASGEGGAEATESTTEGERADPLLDESRRELERPETSSEPPPPTEADGSDESTTAAEEESATTDQQDATETGQRTSESSSQEDSPGERSDDARTAAPSDASEAGAAESPSDTPAQEDGSPSSDGTGPQAGEAELFGAEAATPLEAAIQIEAERLEQLSQQFEARENEDREMPSRAQEAETSYRDVRVPTEVGSESWTPSARVPWKRRAEVRRYFPPDQPADEPLTEGEPP